MCKVKFEAFTRYYIVTEFNHRSRTLLLYFFPWVHYRYILKLVIANALLNLFWKSIPQNFRVLTLLMASDNFFEIIKMVIVVARSAKHLERQVSDYGRRAVIKEKKLPLETVARSELAATWISQRYVADQLRCIQPSSAHEQHSVYSKK